MSLTKTRELRDDYVLVGNPVDMFDIELDPGAASNFKDYLTRDFFPRIMQVVPPNKTIIRFDDHADTTTFRARFGRDRYVNPTGDLVNFTGLSLTHYGPEAWKALALVSRYRQDDTHNKIAVRHRINMFEGRLFEARREVRIIRSVDEDLAYDSPAERLVFDRPLTEENTVSLQDHLTRVIQRCIHSV